MRRVAADGRLESLRPPGDGKAQQKGQAELDPVVAVELKLREQVAERDAQERARGEGQCATDQPRVLLGRSPGRGHEENRSQRHDQREEAVDDMTRRGRPPAHDHHRPQRHRVERLMEEDGEERPQPGGTGRCGAIGQRDGRGQRYARHEAVQCQTHGGAGPRQFVTVPAVPPVIGVGCVMMMEAEEPLDEKHHQEPCQQP